MTQTNSTSVTQATASNLITGGYSQSASESSSTIVWQVSQPAGGSGYRLTATSTDSLSLSRTESGNEITGTFSRSTGETDSTSLREIGTNAGGGFSVSETASSAPTLTETGIPLPIRMPVGGGRQRPASAWE